MSRSDSLQRAERAEEPHSVAAGSCDGRPRPYRAPRLVCYGRLEEVTRFGGSQVVDSGGNLGNQPG